MRCYYLLFPQVESGAGSKGLSEQRSVLGAARRLLGNRVVARNQLPVNVENSQVHTE